MENNLSFPEIGARYVLGVLILIPAAMFNITLLIVLGAAVILTALLGMDPIKAFITSNRKKATEKVKNGNQ